MSRLRRHCLQKELLKLRTEFARGRVDGHYPHFDIRGELDRRHRQAGPLLTVRARRIGDKSALSLKAEVSRGINDGSGAFTVVIPILECFGGGRQPMGVAVSGTQKADKVVAVLPNDQPSAYIAASPRH